MPPSSSVPDRVALVVDGTEYTYRQLETRIRQTCSALAEAGVGPGDRVALVNLGSALSVATIFAAARLGAATAQMNAYLTPGELGQLAELVGARVGVAGAPYADGLRSVVGRPGPGRRGRRSRADADGAAGAFEHRRWRRHRPGALHQRHHRAAQAHRHQPPGGHRPAGLLLEAHRPGGRPGGRHDVGPDLPHRRARSACSSRCTRASSWS